MKYHKATQRHFNQMIKKKKLLTRKISLITLNRGILSTRTNQCLYISLLFNKFKDEREDVSLDDRGEGEGRETPPPPPGF